MSKRSEQRAAARAAREANKATEDTGGLPSSESTTPVAGQTSVGEAINDAIASKVAESQEDNLLVHPGTVLEEFKDEDGVAFKAYLPEDLIDSAAAIWDVGATFVPLIAAAQETIKKYTKGPESVENRLFLLSVECVKRAKGTADGRPMFLGICKNVETSKMQQLAEMAEASGKKAPTIEVAMPQWVQARRDLSSGLKKTKDGKAPIDILSETSIKMSDGSVKVSPTVASIQDFRKKVVARRKEAPLSAGGGAPRRVEHTFGLAATTPRLTAVMAAIVEQCNAEPDTQKGLNEIASILFDALKVIAERSAAGKILLANAVKRQQEVLADRMRVQGAAAPTGIAPQDAETDAGLTGLVKAAAMRGGTR